MARHNPTDYCQFCQDYAEMHQKRAPGFCYGCAAQERSLKAEAKERDWETEADRAQYEGAF